MSGPSAIAAAAIISIAVILSISSVFLCALIIDKIERIQEDLAAIIARMESP